MLKYTDATLVLNTEAQSDGSSADQRVEKSSEADSEEGSALGPAIPALFTEREERQGLEEEFFLRV